MTITYAEVEAFGRARHGDNWKSPLARELGLASRQTFHNWKMRGVPEGVSADLTQLDAVSKGWPRDEWIIGEGPAGERTYLVHAKAPRFICRVALDEGDGPDRASLEGLTFAVDAVEVMCEFVWIDPQPVDEPSLAELLGRGADALGRDYA